MQKKGKDRGRPWVSGISVLVVILISIGAGYWLFTHESNSVPLKYSELLEILSAARQNRKVVIKDVQVNQSEITGKIITRDRISDGDRNDWHEQETNFYTSRGGLDKHPEFVEELKAAHVSFAGAADDSVIGSVSRFGFLLLFIVVMIASAFVVTRWLLGGGSALTFGRSRHKLYAQKDMAITFNDVAGIDEAVAELREVVDFLKRPEKYQALGGRIPKGVLLVGPPGTGKTLLAKAVAGEAEVPFFSMSGSDFVEMFVGVGAARVRDLFDQAESRAPCIIFIDELDALGKTRAGSMAGSHDEREQTLNQLLVEMDGFDSNRGVIIMAATNRPETLDAALLRPGRFDRTVVVDRPDINGREAILKVHVRNVKLSTDEGETRRRGDKETRRQGAEEKGDVEKMKHGVEDGAASDSGSLSPCLPVSLSTPDPISPTSAWKRSSGVDLRRVAGLTPGMVGADLANLVNEAALMAARSEKDTVTMAEFEEAIERSAVGLERKSRIMLAEEKQRVAYHEAGHALVTCVLPNTHPVHKVSIIPRGVGALGYVLSRPDEDRYLVTQSELSSQIKVALGGTMAEEMIFREVSTGATSDLEQASRIARSMVKEFGMSSLGRVNFREQGGPAFLANAPWADSDREYSEQTAREIDVEVRKIIDDATDEVRAILQAHRAALEAVAQRLIDKEVMDGAELRQFLEQYHPGPKLVPGSLPLEQGIQNKQLVSEHMSSADPARPAAERG